MYLCLIIPNKYKPDNEIQLVICSITSKQLGYIELILMGFPDGSAGKESTCSEGDIGYTGLIPGRGRQPTSVFFPEKFHGQRSLVGYSLWGCKFWA